jgi:hypothetical protein
MRKHIPLTIERVIELLSYDSDTGLFVWRKPRRCVNAGDVAGCIRPDGYRVIGIDGGLYRANRLAWMAHYGSLPKHHVDHINGDRDDNRILNLRDVSRSVNAQNLKNAHSDSTHGFLGVCFNKASGKYRADIRVCGRQKHLGQFENANDAHEAYVQAKRDLHEGNTL